MANESKLQNTNANYKFTNLAVTCAKNQALSTVTERISDGSNVRPGSTANAGILENCAPSILRRRTNPLCLKNTITRNSIKHNDLCYGKIKKTIINSIIILEC
jgi:hypothetical protein